MQLLNIMTVLGELFAENPLEIAGGPARTSVDSEVEHAQVQTRRKIAGLDYFPVSGLIERADMIDRERLHDPLVHGVADPLLVDPLGHAEVGATAGIRFVVHIAALMVQDDLKARLEV